MRLIAQVVIGYMYKVLKNNIDTSKFKEEFASIRHGDYSNFLNLIGDEIDYVASSINGVINTDTKIREDDVDFGRLFKSGESLKSFYKLCLKEYGKILDSDIPDNIFEQLGLFELSLRMHRNNNLPRKGRITLETVINELKEIKKLSNEETEILHKGRKFLNNVKRPNKMKVDWKDGIKEFTSAYTLIQSKKLTIY